MRQRQIDKAQIVRRRKKTTTQCARDRPWGINPLRAEPGRPPTRGRGAKKRKIPIAGEEKKDGPHQPSRIDRKQSNARQAKPEATTSEEKKKRKNVSSPPDWGAEGKTLRPPWSKA